MKMTMHIDEDVLAQVMEITGAKSKTRAVEIALKEMARRHKLKKILRAGLQLTPEQWDAEAAPKPSDLIDSPNIDEDAVQRFLATTEAARRRRQQLRAAEDDRPPLSTGDE